MIKEILCFAIIPLKGKTIKPTDPDESNQIDNCDDILHIGKYPMTHNIITNSSNIVFIDHEVDSSSFRKRLKFCWKFLFHYK